MRLYTDPATGRLYYVDPRTGESRCAPVMVGSVPPVVTERPRRSRRGRRLGRWIGGLVAFGVIGVIGSLLDPPPDDPAAIAQLPTKPASGCDPNYTDACVPIASDVDCAGGSGNGPAYVTGPVYVVGLDIYGLDGKDNDGIGCE